MRQTAAQPKSSHASSSHATRPPFIAPTRQTATVMRQPDHSRTTAQASKEDAKTSGAASAAVADAVAVQKKIPKLQATLGKYKNRAMPTPKKTELNQTILELNQKLHSIDSFPKVFSIAVPLAESGAGLVAVLEVIATVLEIIVAAVLWELILVILIIVLIIWLIAKIVDLITTYAERLTACIERCHKILERPSRGRKPQQRNTDDFNKCVNDCMAD